MFSFVSQDQVQRIKKIVMIGVNNTDKKLRSISNWSSKQLMKIYNNRVMDDDEHSIIKKAKVKKGTGSISILGGFVANN